MSKLTVASTIAVIFLVTFSEIFLFTFSDAHSPLDQTEDDVTESQSDVILLPSQKLESEPKPVKEESNPNLQVEPENFHTVDLTKIPIRPESRQSHERIVPLSFRVPLRRGHRCRHGHRQFRHREAPEREGSIGDDTTVEKEKFGSEFGPRPIYPVRLVRIHHRKPRFGNMEMAWDDEMNIPRNHRHRHFARVEHEEKGEENEKEYHHHHHHYHHYPRYEFKGRNGDRTNNGLFVKIRKFLHGI